MNGNEEELSVGESQTKDQKLKPNELTEVVQVHPPPSDANDEIVPETPTPSLTTSSAPPPPPPPPLDTQISVSSITSTMSTVTLKSNHSISGNAHISVTRTHLFNALCIVLSIREKQREASARGIETSVDDIPREETALRYKSRTALGPLFHTQRSAKLVVGQKIFREVCEKRYCYIFGNDRVRRYVDLSNSMIFFRTCKQLRDMTGSEVFNLTRRQLELYCGVAEGSKLYSEISTARIESEVSCERQGYLKCGSWISSYLQKSPRMSELKQILAKARHRVEE